MDIEATTVHKRRSFPTTAMHKQSRTLTKSKPKIRIIHIFAPEIIKTDVSNFRETVQYLTGQQDHHHHHHQKGIKRNPRYKRTHHHHQVHEMNESHGLCINSSEVEEDEEEEETKMESRTWNGNGGESSGGFLNSLGQFDGFFQELGEFTYLPLTIDPALASSSHLHGGSFAESQQFV